MLLTEKYQRLARRQNPPDAIYLPEDDFSALVEEHNTAREFAGNPRMHRSKVKELRVYGIPVKLLEMMPRRGRKEKE